MSRPAIRWRRMRAGHYYGQSGDTLTALRTRQYDLEIIRLTTGEWSVWFLHMRGAVRIGTASTLRKVRAVAEKRLNRRA